MNIAKTMYNKIGAPIPNKVANTNPIRMSAGSIPKYCPKPPHTPVSTLLCADLVSDFITNSNLFINLIYGKGVP